MTSSPESLGLQRKDLLLRVSNYDSREAYLAYPTLPRCWWMQPRKLVFALCRNALRRASE